MSVYGWMDRSITILGILLLSNELPVDEAIPFLDLLYWAAIHQAMADIISKEMKTSVDFVKNQESEDSILSKVSCQYQEPTLLNQDSTQSMTMYKDSITCLVVGAGLGRLVRFCLDAANTCTTNVHVHVHVHAVDANPLAVECLKKSFAPWIENSTAQDPSNIYQTPQMKVTVHAPFSLFPGMQHVDLPTTLQVLYRKCDLLVSELIGCFGDDEFLPELTTTMCHLFLNPNKGISIPKEWCTFIAPIQSASLHSFLSSTGRSSLSTYTVGLPEDCVFMCQPQTLWEGSCYNYKTPSDDGGVWFDWSPFMLKESREIGNITKRRKEEEKEMKKEVEEEEMEHKSVEKKVRELGNIQTLGSLEYEFLIHGLIGYFTTCLYGNIYIDSRHTNRNSFHWECFYMPLQEPISVPLGKYTGRNVVMASVQRSCGIIKRNSVFDSLGTKRLNPDLPNTSKSKFLSGSGMSPGMSMSLNYKWSVKLYLATRKGLLLERELITTGDNIYIHHENQTHQ